MDDDYALEFSAPARDDLLRLHAFYLDRHIELADRALDTILTALDILKRHPHIGRKAQNGDLGPDWRELIIDFGRSGYVALYQIVDESTVHITAVRSLREDDFH